MKLESPHLRDSFLAAPRPKRDHSGPILSSEFSTQNLYFFPLLKNVCDCHHYMGGVLGVALKAESGPWRENSEKLASLVFLDTNLTDDPL